MFCTICQRDEMSTFVTLSCGCKFHGQCIVDYMQRGACNCPNCRQYHPKYKNEEDEEYYEEDVEYGPIIPDSILIQSLRYVSKDDEEASSMLKRWEQRDRILRRLAKQHGRTYDVYYACEEMINIQAKHERRRIQKEKKDSLMRLEHSKMGQNLRSHASLLDRAHSRKHILLKKIQEKLLSY